MKLLLDTANVAQIQHCCDTYSVAGVTTNPSIIAREEAEFFPTLLRLREIIGSRQLHVQVTAGDRDGMLREAAAVTRVLGMETYIKVPTTQQGIDAIRYLKEMGYRVTATAIYSLQQAVLACNAGADYAAPYVNRIANTYGNAENVVADMAKLFATQSASTGILAASFKNTDQIVRCLLAGAHAVTAAPELYRAMVESPLIDAATQRFADDWRAAYGQRTIDLL